MADRYEAEACALVERLAVGGTYRDLAAALRAAERRGAESMRERACTWLYEQGEDDGDAREWSDRMRAALEVDDAE